MQTRAVFVVVAIVALTPLAMVAGGQGRRDSAIVLVGDTRVTTSDDGMTTVVSVDAGGGTVIPDGLVDQAFRVQWDSPRSVTFAGSATLTYAASRLVVVPASSAGWVFTVSGRETPLPAVVAALPSLSAIGLARFWGSFVHVSHEQVAAQLLETGCPGLVQPLSERSCSNCEAGGPGTEGCFIDCPNGSCSATCTDGYYSCCSCTTGCRCCKG
jgi:hypothetical protein